jgi:hypothetical protein
MSPFASWAVVVWLPLVWAEAVERQASATRMAETAVAATRFDRGIVSLMDISSLRLGVEALHVGSNVRRAERLEFRAAFEKRAMKIA